MKLNQWQMTVWIVLVVTLTLLGSAVYALRPTPNKKITVAFYNVENLFDTLDDAQNEGDNDYLPDGRNNWTPERYLKKLNNLSKVIMGIVGGKSAPALIGLAEVENDKVLDDLIKRTTIDNEYSFVHYDSPDERGIDVALLYDSRLFSVKSSEPLAVRFDFEPNDRTRDVLYVNGMLGKQEVHVFVNHWPSRREGMAKSLPKREAAAKVVRQKADAILADNPNAKIIIMGDFNDSPNDKSVKQVLQAQTNYSPVDAQKLYNLSFNLTQKGLGSHRYDGEWNMLDQIIVSGALLSKKGLRTTPNNVHVFKQDWMLYDDKRNGGKSPSTTYGGNKYYGGYSDHLPTFIELMY